MVLVVTLFMETDILEYTTIKGFFPIRVSFQYVDTLKCPLNGRFY